MVTPQQGSRQNPAKRFWWEEEEQGVSKILTINLNDMAKELNIK